MMIGTVGGPHSNMMIGTLSGPHSNMISHYVDHTATR